MLWLISTEGKCFNSGYPKHCWVVEAPLSWIKNGKHSNVHIQYCLKVCNIFPVLLFELSSTVFPLAKTHLSLHIHLIMPTFQMVTISRLARVNHSCFWQTLNLSSNRFHAIFPQRRMSNVHIDANKSHLIWCWQICCKSNPLVRTKPISICFSC